MVVAAVHCCVSQQEQYSAAAVQLQCMIGRVAACCTVQVASPGLASYHSPAAVHILEAVLLCMSMHGADRCWLLT